MRLDTCFFADAATGLEGKLYVHGGGITRLTPPALPYMLPILALVIRLEVEGDEDASPHTIGLRLLDPSGEPVVPPAGFKTEGLPKPDLLEGEEHYVQLTLSLAGIPISQAGVYRLEFAVDGAVVRTLTLPVKEPSPA